MVKKQKTLLEEMLENPKFKKGFEAEKLYFIFQENLCKILNKRKMSYVEFAKLAGITERKAKSILNDASKVTLEQMAHYFYVLDFKVKIKVENYEKIY